MCEHKNPLSLSLNEVNKYIYQDSQEYSRFYKRERFKSHYRIY